MPNIIACFMSVTFDEHITKITIKDSASGEGEEVDFTTSPVNRVAFNSHGTRIVVYFADGYEYDETDINFIPDLEEYTYPTQSWDASTQTLTVTGHSDGSGTVAIKSKAIVQKQTIDVSTLSGWANLATGNHQITIKTKASGYADSASSNAVTVTKAASGYTLHLVREEGLGPDPRFVISYNGEDEFEVPYDTQDYVIENVTTINSLTVTIEMAPGYTGTIVSSELGISVPYNSTSAQSFPVITTATQLTQDTTITISTAAARYSVSVSNYRDDGGQSYEYSTDDGATWNSITAEGQIVSSTTQIKFRVTGLNSRAEAAIRSQTLDAHIFFSAPGNTVGTWIYSDNYTLTQNVDDIVCSPTV